MVTVREEEREEGREREMAPCMEGYQAHLLVGGSVVCHPVLAWEEEWGWGGERQERRMALVCLYPDE